MTVYVDDLRTPARVGRTTGRWSHLFSDDPDLTELHDLAQRIGLRLTWFQEKPAGAARPFAIPHYDVTDAKREAAIEAGAFEVSARATAGILRRRWELIGLHRTVRYAYRERAHLIALAASHQAVTAAVLSTDSTPDRADCSTVLTATTEHGQWTWHIADVDLHLVAHLPHVPADDPRAVWDGHDTALKYQRIAAAAHAHLPTSTVTTGGTHDGQRS